jgi:hypothetical protein
VRLSPREQKLLGLAPITSVPSAADSTRSASTVRWLLLLADELGPMLTTSGRTCMASGSQSEP